MRCNTNNALLFVLVGEGSIFCPADVRTINLLSYMYLNVYCLYLNVLCLYVFDARFRSLTLVLQGV